MRYGSEISIFNESFFGRLPHFGILGSNILLEYPFYRIRILEIDSISFKHPYLTVLTTKIVNY